MIIPALVLVLSYILDRIGGANIGSNVGINQRFEVLPLTPSKSLTPFQLNERKIVCTRHAPTFFSQKQKQLLCGDGSLGIKPSKCAQGALKQIHFQAANQIVKIVIEFCNIPTLSHDFSTEAGSCLGKMIASNSEINYHTAFQICKVATNIKPANCATALILPRGFPFTFTNDLCGSDEGTVEKAECVNALFETIPENDYSVNDTLVLCRKASSIGPVLSCALTMQNTPPSIVAELCKGAMDSHPIQCYRKAKLSSQHLKAQLCSSSTTSATATCANYPVSNAFLNLNSITLRELNIIELCRDATELDGINGIMPWKCLEDVLSYTNISWNEAIRLCRSSKTLDSSNCYKQSKVIFNNRTLALLVCEHSQSAKETISCLKEAPFSFPDEKKAILCNNASNSNPGRCASLLMNINQNFEIVGNDPFKHSITKFCQSSKDLGSAYCFLSAPTGLSIEEKLKLCSGKSIEDRKQKLKTHCSQNEDKRNSVVMEEHNFSLFQCISEGLEENLSSKLVLELCSRDNVRYQSVLSCAANAPFGFDSDEIGVLCSNAMDAAPISCASSSFSLRFTKMERALLCKNVKYSHAGENAMSSNSFLAPIECMKLVQHIIGLDEALTLCSRSLSLTPAYCGLSLPISYSVADLSQCRNITSIPSNLIIHGNEDSIFPGVYFSAQASIEDQFGQHRVWDNYTKVTATLPLHENGTEKFKLTETSVLGEITFNGLKIDNVGIYLITFCIQNGKKDRFYEGICTSIKVNVSPNNEADSWIGEKSK